MPSAKPLDGFTVVEVAAFVMVPSAATMLADLGANVVKIEHPRFGDPARGLVTGGYAPSVGGIDLMMEQNNRGKRSIGLDISRPEGREILLELVARADVFMTSFLPAVRAKLGIELGDVRAHNERIVYACGDAVGPQGPEAGKPGFDSAVFFGRAGILNSFAGDGALPAPRPGFGDKTSGLALGFGIVSALLQRERTGLAPTVDVSLLGTAAWVASSDIIYSWLLDEDFSKVEQPVSNPISNRYRTSDGRWIMLAMLASDRWWPSLCKAIGRADLIGDQRFVDAAARSRNRVVCAEELAATFVTASLDEWRRRLESLVGPWEVIQNSREVIDDPQVQANGYVGDVHHPSGAELKAVRSPVQFDGQVHEIGAAPAAWEQTEEILIELGHDWERISQLKDREIIP